MTNSTKGRMGGRIRQALRRVAEIFDPGSAAHRLRRCGPTRTSRLTVEVLEPRAMLSGYGPAIDDYPDAGNWSAAAEISVEPTARTGSLQGRLEKRFDNDLFRFVAAVSGKAMIRVDTPNSSLDPVLYVAGDESSPVVFTAAANEVGEPVLSVVSGGSSHPLIARTNDYHGRDSRVTIDVVIH